MKIINHKKCFSITSFKLTILIIVLFLNIELYADYLGLEIPASLGYLLLGTLAVANFCTNSFYSYPFTLTKASLSFSPFLIYALASSIYTQPSINESLQRSVAIAFVWLIIFKFESKKLMSSYNLSAFLTVISANYAIYIYASFILFLSGSGIDSFNGRFIGFSDNAANCAQQLFIGFSILISYFLHNKKRFFFTKVSLLLCLTIDFLLILLTRGLTPLVLIFYFSICLFFNYFFKATVLQKRLVRVKSVCLNLFIVLFFIFLVYCFSYVIIGEPPLDLLGENPFSNNWFNLEQLLERFDELLSFINPDSIDDIGGRKRLYSSAWDIASIDLSRLLFGYGIGYVFTLNETLNDAVIYTDSGYLGIVIDLGLAGLSLLLVFV
ncbi:MAG: hypothetical protein F6K11_35000, partial [Leptolyngbya sp. SIO3F4]|nr:hypothetical protein [Leptolyngbya sp. SIO3F4]